MLVKSKKAKQRLGQSQKAYARYERLSGVTSSAGVGVAGCGDTSTLLIIRTNQATGITNLSTDAWEGEAFKSLVRDRHPEA